MIIISKDFYSNCLIQTLKHKLLNWSKVHIQYLPAKYREIFVPHFMWTDGVNDYDFGTEKKLKNPIMYLWFKGHLRKYDLGRNQKYINLEISRSISRQETKKMSLQY